MADQVNQQKNTKAPLNLKSASFKPKVFKPKVNMVNIQSPQPQNYNSESQVKHDYSMFGALPNLLNGKMNDKNSIMMPFPSLLNGPPPMDMSNLLSFGPGPMKPPPLLFSQSDHISPQSLNNLKSKCGINCHNLNQSKAKS